MSKPKTTADLTHREAWDLIYTITRGADLMPLCIEVMPSPHVERINVQLMDDDHEGVTRLMALLRLGKPATYLDRNTGEPYRWFAGEPHEFTAYGLYSPEGYEPNSPVFPGWIVKVYAQMVTANHEAQS